MVYHTYILAGNSGVLYTGVTNFLERRIVEHKGKLTPGFTARYNVDKLVYFEAFSEPQNVIAREKQLEKWSRIKKVRLIEKRNPTWRDLSEDFSV
jgi:putative endonuclease